MPDTGAPWDIPYLDGTELVRDYPQASEDLADAIAAGLSAAVGLVAVKHALLTGTQSASTAAGANFAVTDLTITHTLADAANKLIISAYIGALGSSGDVAAVGIGVMDGSTFIGAGDAAGSRTTVGAGGKPTASGDAGTVNTLSQSFVYSPGDTTSRTYTVRAINVAGAVRTLYVNRTELDSDDASLVRASSGLVIQEVRV
jgi:hypothetical protein